MIGNHFQPSLKETLLWNFNCILIIINLAQLNHLQLVEYHFLVEKQLYIWFLILVILNGRKIYELTSMAWGSLLVRKSVNNWAFKAFIASKHTSNSYNSMTHFLRLPVRSDWGSTCYKGKFVWNTMKCMRKYRRSLHNDITTLR